jgi:biotin transport system substrate-specific component
MSIAFPRMNRVPVDQRGITIGDFLVPIRVGESISTRARHLVLIVAGALLVAAVAQIYIPALPVPFTGSTFGVLLVGGALGFRRAAASLGLYLVLGIVGLPVFAQGDAGLNVMAGPTGGYLVGFVVAGALVGRLAELGWDRHVVASIGAMVLGSLAIYAFGVAWLVVGVGLTPAAAVAGGVVPFLVWDTIKLLAAAALFPAAWWVVGRRPGER